MRSMVTGGVPDANADANTNDTPRSATALLVEELPKYSAMTNCNE
jgi:hypothetical protein